MLYDLRSVWLGQNALVNDVRNVANSGGVEEG